MPLLFCVEQTLGCTKLLQIRKVVCGESSLSTVYDFKLRFQHFFCIVFSQHTIDPKSFAISIKFNMKVKQKRFFIASYLNDLPLHIIEVLHHVSGKTDLTHCKTIDEQETWAAGCFTFSSVSYTMLQLKFTTHFLLRGNFFKHLFTYSM